jgi:glycosyltransferase involved in cell wall biosynthesis
MIRPDAKPLLTVMVIARDEETTLPGLFASLVTLPKTLQILVVDTGSQDGTCKLALDHGADVHDFTWCDDFSAARNHALALCHGKWILWLDADDILPTDSAQWLNSNLDCLNPDSTYAFRVVSADSNARISTLTQIRLIPNHRGLKFRNRIHENLGESVHELGLSVISTDMEIVHTGYSDVHTVERKRIRNRALLEKSLTTDALDATDPSPSLRFAWGRMMMAEARWKDAENAFRLALAAPQSTSPEVRLAARTGLGQSLGFQNRPLEALAEFELEMELQGPVTNAQYLLEYGKALWMVGDTHQARAAWMNCLVAGPDYGAVPTDWETVLEGARDLLKATKTLPIPPPRRKPQEPDAIQPSPRGENRWLNLSVCTILKNEAENLPGLIGSLPLSQIEWIVLDTGSTDATVAMVRKAGVNVHTFAWINDFSAARNASLALANRDWILWLDGDDRIDESFWEAIAPLLQGPKQAYRFTVRSPRENSHGERFLQIRLFPNHMDIAFEGRIHEQVGSSLQKLKIKAVPVELEILHIGYDTPAKRSVKLVRNRALLEQERIQFPNDPTVILEYGNCLYQSGEYDSAKTAYLALMPSKKPDECRAIPADEVLRHFPSLLGETCAQLQADLEALAWFQLATHWNPTDIQPFYWLGKKALENHNIAGALEYFYAAIDRPALVGRVATDSYTVRRNALALVFLCETQLFGAKKAPRARQCLTELIAGGLKAFPLEYRAPWDYFLEVDAKKDAEKYAEKYLSLFPNDYSIWEDFLEFLLTAGRHQDMLEAFTAYPNLVLVSGVLEAFRAKALDAGKAGLEAIYGIYRTGLEKFPEDPTLLVYFSDFVNHNKLYSRCYSDLKALPKPSAPVREFLRQMESQGLGNGNVT